MSKDTAPQVLNLVVANEGKLNIVVCICIYIFFIYACSKTRCLFTKYFTFFPKSAPRDPFSGVKVGMTRPRPLIDKGPWSRPHSELNTTGLTMSERVSFLQQQCRNLDLNNGSHKPHPSKFYQIKGVLGVCRVPKVSNSNRRKAINIIIILSRTHT